MHKAVETWPSLYEGRCYHNTGSNTALKHARGAYVWRQIGVRFQSYVCPSHSCSLHFQFFLLVVNPENPLLARLACDENQKRKTSSLRLETRIQGISSPKRRAYFYVRENMLAQSLTKALSVLTRAEGIREGSFSAFHLAPFNEATCL